MVRRVDQRTTWLEEKKLRSRREKEGRKDEDEEQSRLAGRSSVLLKRERDVRGRLDAAKAIAREMKEREIRRREIDIIRLAARQTRHT